MPKTAVMTTAVRSTTSRTVIPRFLARGLDPSGWGVGGAPLGGTDSAACGGVLVPV